MTPTSGLRCLTPRSRKKKTPPESYLPGSTPHPIMSKTARCCEGLWARTPWSSLPRRANQCARCLRLPLKTDNDEGTDDHVPPRKPTDLYLSAVPLLSAKTTKNTPCLQELHPSVVCTTVSAEQQEHDILREMHLPAVCRGPRGRRKMCEISPKPQNTAA